MIFARSKYMQEKLLQNTKNFYDAQYRDQVYATGADHEMRLAWVKSHLDKIGWENARVLEIGCGCGQLQDAAPGYVGFDISRESGRNFTKPFFCGVAEAFPMLMPPLPLIIMPVCSGFTPGAFKALKLKLPCVEYSCLAAL
jgi:hypothetical protein